MRVVHAFLCVMLHVLHSIKHNQAVITWHLAYWNIKMKLWPILNSLNFKATKNYSYQMLISYSKNWITKQIWLNCWSVRVPPMFTVSWQNNSQCITLSTTFNKQTNMHSQWCELEILVWITWTTLMLQIHAVYSRKHSTISGCLLDAHKW